MENIRKILEKMRIDYKLLKRIKTIMKKKENLQK